MALADQVPRAQPLPVPALAGSAHTASAGGLAGWAGLRCGADLAHDASDRTDVLRLRSLLPLSRVKLDLLVLIQRPVTGARDRGEMHEHVRRPVIGGDEAETLIGVEPLHCSCSHEPTSSICHPLRDVAAPTASLPVLDSPNGPSLISGLPRH